MRVCVWGAGTIGRGIARRLVGEPFVSTLHWVNRGDAVQGYVFDLKHGLAFAPSCHDVLGYDQSRAKFAISRSEVVIVTHGVGVTGGDRASLYPRNRSIMRETVIPALAGFSGLVLVISNPVELLARLILREAGLGHDRVIGLGTLVETARARAALADHLSPSRPARDIPVIAVGTHDEHVVLQLDAEHGLDVRARERILARTRHEVVEGARRVKAFAEATQHPIVEAAIEVVRAVAHDSRGVLPIAAFDAADELFYSIPCILGHQGIMERRIDMLSTATRAALEAGKTAMRSVLFNHPDSP